MKIRQVAAHEEKIEIPMAPMIDVVFQLLIFFLLTLKLIAPEGNFSINMPIGAPVQQNDKIALPDLKVRLVANPDGSLNRLQFGGRNLGNDETAFERLNNEILRYIGRPDNPLMKDVEVEIDADYNLNYRYTMRAVSACSGRIDPKSGQVVRYVKKVKFAAPRRPAKSGT